MKELKSYQSVNGLIYSDKNRAIQEDQIYYIYDWIAKRYASTQPMPQFDSMLMNTVAELIVGGMQQFKELLVSFEDQANK